MTVLVEVIVEVTVLGGMVVVTVDVVVSVSVDVEVTRDVEVEVMTNGGELAPPAW